MKTLTLFGRLIKHFLRSGDTIVTAVIQPVALMMLFVFVFGGAIKVSLGEGVNYVNYQLPGILLMTVGYGISYTALRIFNDKHNGITARFNTMPIPRSSILWGHVLASLVSTVVTIVIIFIFALIIGFRPKATITEWLLIFGILILFTIALTWVAVIPGLKAKTVEGASALAFPVIFLPLFSPAFTPTELMPTPLRIFADNQPVTAIVESLRALINSDPVGNDIWIALAWCVGIMLVAWFFAMRAYRKQT